MGWSSNRQLVVAYLATALALSQGVAAPPGPQNVRVLNATSNSLTISWSSLPFAPGFTLDSFQVVAEPVFSYSENIQPYEGTASGQKNSFVLLGLEPATRYNISIWGETADKNFTDKSFVDAWTLIGDLTAPPRPEVTELEEGGKRILSVKINPPDKFQAPISKYQIVVLESDSVMAFDPAKLSDYDKANEDGTTYYIAGERAPNEIASNFIVGDGKTNPVLPKDQKFDILIGVISTLNGETKSVYSAPLFARVANTDANANPNVENAEEPMAQSMRRRDAVLVFVLSVVIGILGFLLVASFILYVILRRQYSQKRRSDELILKIHDHDNDNTYFGNGHLHLGEGADLNGFYNKLCDLYWQIPRPQLHISEVMLGQGTYGPVRVGKVLRNGQEIAAQIQRCGAHFALSDRDRRVLLSDLEAMVRIGAHPNVVEFIGGCEEGDALWMATEYPNNPLRGLLLSSRQTQEDNRICSIPEYRLMEMAISLADGLKHLVHRGVTHGHLSTRSILVALPDMVPKISNFCLAKYTPLGKKLDYTRWTAPEAIRRRVTHKGDVWSFGVLLWELFTLGGTPYVDVRVNEVQTKLSRGHRLAQPRGVETSLFQLMLHCWEMDPDERPTFEDLARDLRNVASEDPLRLPRQSKYIYDKFDPLADEC